jgi:autotransporter strand-loop-strand O-heptosyltransferase
MIKRAYVIYGTKTYLPILEQCALSIVEMSDSPVFMYLLDNNFDDNYYLQKNVTVFSWPFNIKETDLYEEKSDGNFYIRRERNEVYRILIERIRIVQNALTRAETIAYIDADSVVTENIDRIFNMYNNEPYVFATEGVYDWMLIDGRGGADSMDDLSTTLEYPACELFGADQFVRKRYRQSGYFVAGQTCKNFLNKWWSMCNHPNVLEDPQLYAPYHEETLLNVLLWKNNFHNGLPYMYMNGNSEMIEKIYLTNSFIGETYFLNNFKRVPSIKENLLAFHGEKRPDEMMKMRKLLKEHRTKMCILYLAPHLSTGGMPAFLLKRLQALRHPKMELIVVEYANWSDEYVVHKNQIKVLADVFYTLGENKMELINIIKKHHVDVVHVEEMVEDSGNAFPIEMINALYSNNRTWNIVETCHNIIFKPDTEKKYHPDAYMFCTPFHLHTFKNMSSRKFVVEYPIEKIDITFKKKSDVKLMLGIDVNKKHVLNVGLWTPGKNQAEGIEIARQMPDIEFHFVGNQAINFKHYWEPLMQDLPANVYVWGERSDVHTFMMAADVFMFNSTWECNPLVIREAIGYGLPILARNLPQYMDMFTKYIVPLSENNVVEQLREMLVRDTISPEIDSQSLFNFQTSHMNVYNDVKKNEKRIQKININIHFVGQPFLEIKGGSNSDYLVKFIDENELCIYENTIKANHWVRLNRRWFTKWRVMVWEDGQLIHDEVLNYKNERVYIALDSSSLGDTIAWMPYVNEFRINHECNVIVSTFKNFLFEDSYPELEFVKPGTVVKNIKGMYSIGWYYDANREPILPNTIPLQKAATNILGLEYKEIKPLLSFVPGIRPVNEKYVTIATNSTAGCKFWTKKGWQEVIDFLVEKEYKVFNVSKEDNKFINCPQLQDRSLENTMNYIHHSEFFIGLSSGLSWLAWAINKPVVMISNFTEENHEFQCIRPINKNVCNSCWNSHKYRFDKTWNWCPVHAGTPRMFECQTSIKSEDVIKILPLQKQKT